MLGGIIGIGLLICLVLYSLFHKISRKHWNDLPELGHNKHAIINVSSIKTSTGKTEYVCCASCNNKSSSATSRNESLETALCEALSKLPANEEK